MPRIKEEYTCWNCGKLIEYDEEPQKRVYCTGCFEEFQKNHDEKVEKYLKLKDEVMYDTALRTMEKAGVFMYEYEESAKRMKQLMEEKTGIFRSSDELITAIILDENNYDFKINFRVQKYIVDFYIPELKVCLEVDGRLHDFSIKKDSERDIDIRDFLGLEWEVLRIPTKYIEKNPILIPEILIKMKQEKKNIRKENNGILPEHYSRRERALYSDLVKYKTYRVRKV